MDPFAANQTPVADDAAIVNRYPMPLARAWRLVLELINQYQLRLAKHPPAPDSGWEPMSIVTALAPGLRAALARLALLADYPLLGLVRDAAGQVQVLRLMGFTAEESSVEMEP